MKKDRRRVYTWGLILGMIVAVWMALPVHGAENTLLDPFTGIAEHAVFDQGSCERGYHKLLELWKAYEESGKTGSFNDYVTAGDWYRAVSDTMPITTKGLESWRETFVSA